MVVPADFLAPKKIPTTFGRAVRWLLLVLCPQAAMKLQVPLQPACSVEIQHRQFEVRILGDPRLSTSVHLVLTRPPTLQREKTSPTHAHAAVFHFLHSPPTVRQVQSQVCGNIYHVQKVLYTYSPRAHPNQFPSRHLQSHGIGETLGRKLWITEWRIAGFVVCFILDYFLQSLHHTGDRSTYFIRKAGSSSIQT